MTIAWPKQSNMNGFYGNPDKNKDGRPDADWEASNLVKIIPPYTLYYPSEKIVNNKKVLIKRATKMKSLTVHKNCADAMLAALTAIGKEFSPEELIKYELDICGGAYNFRLMRNGRSLSIHSWGAAIDLSHLINSYKRKYDEKAGMMPQRAVKIFKNQGATWGGRWSTPDGMHFQFADI